MGKAGGDASRSLLEGKNAVFVPEVGRRGSPAGTLAGLPGPRPRVPSAGECARVVFPGSALALGYLPYLSGPRRARARRGPERYGR